MKINVWIKTDEWYDDNEGYCEDGFYEQIYLSTTDTIDLIAQSLYEAYFQQEKYPNDIEEKIMENLISMVCNMDVDKLGNDYKNTIQDIVQLNLEKYLD